MSSGALRSVTGSWWYRACTSSVGQKVLMGLTGLGLCGFLVGHLAGNVLLFSGPEAYNHYAHRLHEWELLPVIEALLFAAFGVHIVLAFCTAARNRAARGVGYAVKQSKINGVLAVSPHNFMMVTGLVILAFLVLHITDMKLADMQLRLTKPENESSAEMALRVLRNPLSAIGYIIGALFVGVHVSHGLQSAFRSLGFDHPKYSPGIRKLSVIFGVAMALGFASLPVYFFLLNPK